MFIEERKKKLKAMDKIITENLKRWGDMSGVLTTEDTMWDWFIQQLGGDDGISLRNSQIKICDNLCMCNGYPFTEGILEKMSSFPERDSSFNINIQKTLEWFKLQGWLCDCQVFFNWIYRSNIFEKNHPEWIA
ncbi:hypothetical protein ACFLZM_06060 [Thermodesulfobacteriota bacterium]